MARKKVKKIRYRALHDISSSAEHDQKHQAIKEKIICESRKENLLHTLTLVLEVAIAAVLTLSVIVWFMRFLK